ncbi:MAG: competence/damage-inducible protein A, partial [Mogibacterium diversum]|nr:competence/damage-inducible protein A [Mogibacterium diversum]
MNVSIIAVGTELLFGQTVNTNATYISNQLNLMGFNVMYHHVVGDNSGRLKALIISTFVESDMIILTGGLG